MVTQPSSQANLDGLSILIIGAGIGGLTTALELHRRGIAVRILERTASENQLGDSFSIGPSALDCIKRNLPEVYHDMEQIVFEPQVYFNKHTGERVLGPTRWAYDRPGKNGQMTIGVARFTRPQLHHILLKHVENANIELTWGKQVKDYYEDVQKKKAGVTCEDGSVYEADLVIAADGVRTASWALIGGAKPPARSSGKAIFRTAFPLEYAMKEPELVERFRLDVDQPYFEIYHGPKIHGGIGRTKSELTWAITHVDSGSAEEHWGNRVHPEVAAKLLEDIPGWDPLFIKAVRLTPPDQLIDWKLMFRDPQPQWHSPGGLVIQLGDSAHSFLPTSGNGGTQAMEDAFSLVTCLAYAGKTNIAEAVKVHCKLRFERVSCIQLLGFYNQFNRESVDWSKVKETPESINMKLGSWILDHDPETYALDRYAEAVEHIRTGAEFKNTNLPKGYVCKPWTLDEMMNISAGGGKLELGEEWFD